MKLCEGKGLKSRKINRWLAWALAATVLLSGCSGVLFESKGDAGKVERVKIDGGEGWDTYDDRPRLPFSNSKKHGLDDMGLILKSEKTF